MDDRVRIFDTTLRDGEQAPGCSMMLREKLRVAKMLAELNVDIIEAGFPAASPGDFESVKAIADENFGPVICGLARCNPDDIEKVHAAVKGAEKHRIHVFVATSEIHREYKLRMAKEEIIKSAVGAIKMARELCEDVEFSPEDASRTELSYLAEVVSAAIEAGATTINIPDTVGYNIPHQFGDLIKQLIERVPNSDKAVFSVHCHNDLGLAVANSLSAVLAGARQVECTINGLGERAGNASLEEIIMAVRTRKDAFPCDSTLDTTQILTCSKLVAGITGFNVQPNKAIVGANAFAHESGIHQDGVLKSRETYEIMRPQDVGWATNRLVLGKHSGRNAFKTRMKELNIDFSSEQELNEVFIRFKALADKKHDIFDEDLQALVTESALDSENESIKLVSLRVCCETGETPNATMTLNINGKEQKAESPGDGPVDACFKAIEKITATGVNLQLYSVNAITTGTDSQGEVTVRVEKDGYIVNGQGADTDIVIASAKSYINALNKVINNSGRTHPQTGDV